MNKPKIVMPLHYIGAVFNKVIILVLALGLLIFDIFFPVPLAKANINEVPSAPENVIISQNANSLEVSWSAPSPEPSSDWTYKVELVDEIDRTVQTAQNISKSVLTQIFQNQFTGNYSAKVYTQTSDGQISLAAESDKSKPAQIALGAASANINFADISGLEAESQAKIKWAAAFGITTGYTPTTYDPRKAVNRRQMASFFKRLAGGPAPSGQPIKFKDVTDKEQNKADIDWLSAAGITTGYMCTAKGKPDKTCTKKGDTVYRPGAVVNRGQMAQFIYKYVGQPYISPDEVNSYMAEFSDNQKLRDNGQAEAVAWLLKYNITRGYPDSTYRPTTRVSREQMAVFLARLANILNITPYLVRESIETNENLVLPTNFLNIPSLNRKDITKISFRETLPVCDNPTDVSSSKNGSILGCVENGTEIVIGEPLGVKANSYSADGLFSNLSTSALQSLDFSTLSDLGNVISTYAAFAVDSGFANSAISDNFVFPQGFGVNSENMSYMFANRVFAENRTFEKDFAKNVANMNGMFSGVVLNGDIDWIDTDLSASTASKTDMFANTVWNGYFIFVQNLASRTFLITNSNISDPSRIKIKAEEPILKKESTNPASFLGITSPTRGQITKISFQNTLPVCSNPIDVSENARAGVIACVENSTEIVIGANGQEVQANSDSSWLFSNLSLPTKVYIDLTNLDTSQVQDMSYIFASSKLKFTPIWPSGFGQVAVNMQYMFFDASLPDQFVFPQGFGNAAVDMSYMFEDTALGGDIDWSSTDLAISLASKTNMFTNVDWNGHFIIVQNLASRTFLITNSNISSSSRIRVKGAEPILKTESADPMTFLGITSPTRAQITKISFQNTLPECSNPIDVSRDGKAGVLACVENGTKIIIGANGQEVQANPESSWLFGNLSLSAGAELDLFNLDTAAVTGMSSMFRKSVLRAGSFLPVGFGSAATNMNFMFEETSLPLGFSLPAGFGSAATAMSVMFRKAVIPLNFAPPAGFGSVAVDIGSMFAYVTLPAGLTFPQGFGAAATSMSGIFLSASLPAGLTFPQGFGAKATLMIGVFQGATLPAGFALPAGFGSVADNMSTMFANVALPAGLTFPQGFGSRATNMAAMFYNTTLNGDIDWSDTNLATSSASKSNMFANIVWNDHFIIVQNLASRTFLINNSNIDEPSQIIVKGIGLLKTENPNSTTFLGITSPTRAQITKISFQSTLPECDNPIDVSRDGQAEVLACVQNNTEIIVGANGQVQANPNSSWLFSNLPLLSPLSGINLSNLDTTTIVNMANMFRQTALPSGFSLPAGFGSAATDMEFMFYDTSLPSDFSLPTGFGSVATNMRYMFTGIVFPSAFILPAGFGQVADNMLSMFAYATLPARFSLPAGFGSAADDMNAMFSYAVLNGDVDWSNTNLLTSTTSKTNMFANIVWNGHFIFVKNSASRTFLITNSNISDPIRIQSLDAGRFLKAEDDDDETFLGITSPTRPEITKISFQSTLPTCSNPIDVSEDGAAGVLVCVQNNTEIIVGANGQVRANHNSSYLFCWLSLSGGVVIDLSGLDTAAARNMSGMFRSSILSSDFSLPAGFGSAVTDMSGMFENTALPARFSLPQGFGNMAITMSSMFFQTTLPTGLTFPQGFGSQAVNMSNMFWGATLPAGFVLPAGFSQNIRNMVAMFMNATLNGDIDWSNDNLADTMASKDDLFASTDWNGHFIFVQNSDSRIFLITNSNISNPIRIVVKGAEPIPKAENSDPVTFLGITSPTRAQITKISFQSTLPECDNPIDVSRDGQAEVLACVQNNTEIIVGANGQVQANSNSSWLFSNLTITGGVNLNLSGLNMATAINMMYMFRASNLSNIIAPDDFGSAATNMSGIFVNAVLPANFSLGEATGFGSQAIRIDSAFFNVTFPANFSLPAGFGSAADDMRGVFNYAKLNDDIDWIYTDLSTSSADKTDMFSNVVWNGHYIFVKNSASRAFLISNSNISDPIRVQNVDAGRILKTESDNPTTFLGITSPTRAQITGISFQSTLPTCSNPIDVSQDGQADVIACVKDDTKIIIGANGQVQANPNSSWLFSNLSSLGSLMSSLNLSNLDTTTTVNMSNMFRQIDFPSDFRLPAGFGSTATDMSNMFRETGLSPYTFPAGFGSAATDMSDMFRDASDIDVFNLPAGFGSQATNMNRMFWGVTVYNTIDWSGTDLSNSAASKDSMFFGVDWSDHYNRGYLIAQNEASRTFLITNSNISDPSRIIVQGSESILRQEKPWPKTFLGITSPTRAQITKISFQNTIPNCSSQIDVSQVGFHGVIACVRNSTEIVIGANGQVKANSDSSYLFYGLSAGVTIDLSSLDTAATTSMSDMFEESKLSNIIVPAGFGSTAIDMNNMFYNAILPKDMELPAGFGSTALYMTYMFRNAIIPVFFSLPAGFGSVAAHIDGMFNGATVKGFEYRFSLPVGFGSQATDMSNMFENAVLESDIDWSGTDLSNLAASKTDMFANTTWNSHFILVQNQSSVNWLTDGTGASFANVKVE
ncbi:MAG: BspA family leucine-rich repeat surface protein [Bifidobacteriaceae bacterium]|jgi:cell shape-determining protein MreC|nr:BspA family leucine-rich repeat surface protein [Bifidobacteriaceae bacterium]